MEGIYVGCRTAVFLFPYDLSCAWDSFHVPQGGKCIVGEDAMKIGINLCAYTISYYNLGRFLSQRKTLDTDDDVLKGDFIFAQVKTNGLWDPHPSAFANVLKTTLAATNSPPGCAGRSPIVCAGPRCESRSCAAPRPSPSTSNRSRRSPASRGTGCCSPTIVGRIDSK